MIQFSIDYPPKFGGNYGLNSIYSGKHWYERNKDAEFWHGHVLGTLKKQGIRRGVYKYPVTITFYWDDRLDCSNHAYAGKMIEDALKGYLIKDDSRKWVKEITHKFHTGKCILVEIEVKKDGD